MRASDFDDTEPILIPDLNAIALIVIWGLVWLVPGLDHPSIHNWDESFHQAVVRGTANHFYPTMYEDPFYPLVLRGWWYSGIWLHKAAGVFWWGALMTKIFGVSTACLRSASLLSEIGAAVLVYLMARPLAGRLLSFIAALALLVLPFGWILVQGHFVADVTDVSVAAFVTLGMAWLWWAAEKDSKGWAFAAGAAIGVAYLCKTFLALAPLGVAGAWWFLARIRFCKGPRFVHVLLMFAGALIVAAPWNVFAFFKWHDVYMRAFDHTTGFMSATSGEDVGSGARPADAIFNEINWTIVRSIPHPFSLLAGIWLAVRAVKDRDGRLVALALWLWSTWVVHSIANVKGHGHLWNAVPAMMISYAILLRDAFRYRALGGAVLASCAVWHFRPVLSVAASIRSALPVALVQTRTWADSNLVEQALLVPPAIVAAWLLGFIKPLAKCAAVALAIAGAAFFCVWCFVENPRLIAQQKKDMAHERHWSSSQDVGLALDPVLEQKAVIFMDTNADFGTAFEYNSLMFWSGRMVYRAVPDAALAQAHGYHPYLVSPAAEAYEPMPQVPAYASLRAYDMLKPSAAQPPPLPPGVTPLDQTLRTVHVLGWAAGRESEQFSRYAFFVAPVGMPTDVRVIFHLDDGTSETQVLPVLSTMRSADRLAGVPWFVLPALGPPHPRVKSVELQQ